MKNRSMWIAALALSAIVSVTGCGSEEMKPQAGTGMMEDKMKSDDKMMGDEKMKSDSMMGGEKMMGDDKMKDDKMMSGEKK